MSTSPEIIPTIVGALIGVYLGEIPIVKRFFNRQEKFWKETIFRAALQVQNERIVK